MEDTIVSLASNVRRDCWLEYHRIIEYEGSMHMTVGLIGIIVALLLFLYLVYKGCSPFWTAIISAIIVVLTNLVADTPVLTQIADSISGSFLDGMLSMITNLFAVIFLGAILGRIYAETGAAESIARTLLNAFVIKREGKAKVTAAILVLWFVSAVCTMGGIDGYVLTFTLFPISLIVFEMCNMPRRYIPAAFCLNCAFMTAPGAPQIYNIMAEAAVKSQIPVFTEKGATAIVGQLAAVSSTSALIPGLVGTVIITVCGVITLIYMINKAMEKGEVFDYGPVAHIELPDRKLPHFLVSLLPLLFVFVLYTILKQHIFIALLGGVILALVTMLPNLPSMDREGNAIRPVTRLVNVLNGGANGYPNALLTVSTPAGLAGVITATATFGALVGMLSGLNVSPIVLTVIVVCVVVAITSAPPTAMMIAVPMILGIVTGPLLASATNVAAVTLPVSAHAILRISALAASTFETLPINGLIILGLGLAKTSHKESYKPMFLMTVAYTFLATVVCAALCAFFPGLAV